MQSYTLEQLAKHYEATQSDVHRYVTEADFNKLAAKLDKLTCAVNDVLNGEADLTDLAEACDMKPEQSLVERDIEVRINELESLAVYLAENHFLHKETHDGISAKILELGSQAG
jgi:phenylalanyl-tRNA synthetase beta subunit